jgi:glucokinase
MVRLTSTRGAFAKGAGMGRTFIGVDLGGTNLRAAIVNEDAKILGQAKMATKAQEGPPAVIGRIIAVAKDAVKATGLSMSEITACGIGSPGPLNAATGILVYTANMPGWNNTPVAAPVGEALGVRTFLENDANSAAWGEYWCGAGRGSSEMAIFTLGTGVGGSVIVGGRLHRGSDQMAGHVGHIILVPEGRPCGCGAYGCLEQYCSATAVAREAREATAAGVETGLAGLAPEAITAEAVAKAATAGEPFCRDLLARTGRMLGIGMASVVNVLDPQVIVVYGGMVAAGELLLKPCRDAIRRLALRPASGNVKVVEAELGGNAGVIGAAGLAMRRSDGEKA